MQIGNILGAVTAQNPKLQTLSSSQHEKLDSILSKYDGNNFTKDDFLKLGSELRSAGIRPSDEVKTALESKGINVEKFKNLNGPVKAGPAGGPPPGKGPGGPGGPGGPPPPPPPKKEKSSDTTSATEDLDDLIATFIEKLHSQSTTQSDTKKLISALSENGIFKNGVVVDKVV